MRLIAKRMNYKTRKYEPCHVPDNAVIMAGLNDVVQCANCGRPVRFGNTFSSSDICNDVGIDYAVCLDCYRSEKLMRYWMEQAEKNEKKSRETS